MIYLTGDTHGMYDFAHVKEYFKDKKVSYDDYLIVLGDCGVCWSVESYSGYLENFESLGLTILFIDGNHENFDMLNSLPIVEYLGARMHQVSSHMYHILRGEVMTLGDKTFLCLGGAESIDKAYRVEGRSWWKEETITFVDVEHARENLRKVNFKVDYVLTHCIDSATVVNQLMMAKDQSTDMLSWIDWEVDYRKWFCGHYHCDERLTPKKRVLYLSVLELKD